jgi:uncharacterized protein YnzC (UPF0291/DUF896 family)
MAAKKKFQKLTEEEITQLTELQNNYNQVVKAIGGIETQLWILEQRKTSLKEQFANVQQIESEIGKTLEDKYGNGTISLEEGKFFPAE